MNNARKQIIVGLLMLLGQNVFAQVRNLIQEDIIKVEGIKQDTAIFKLGILQRQSSRVYLDGFGRPIQEIAVKGSPGQKDIIQFSVYDPLGRDSKKYLPYASNDGTGNFHGTMITEQSNFYKNGTTDKIADDLNPFSQEIFDNSPLQKLLTKGEVGTGYQPGEHGSSIVHRTNLSTELVRRWNPDGTAAANFAAGTLDVQLITGADGEQTVIYTDKSGQVVLKKQLLNELISGSNVPWLETYYVYDDLGLLHFVVPPKAVAVMASSGNYSLLQTAMNGLLFRYEYDGLGRTIEKTVPGAGTVYFIYDPLNRPVLIQDENLRATKKWNYIKYDKRGVVISQGIYTNLTLLTRTAMQSYVTGLNYSVNYFEKRNGVVATGYYSNIIFPTVDVEPLAYNYFDDYDLDGNGSPDYSYQVQGINGEGVSNALVQGLPTISRKRTLGAGLNNIWLSSVVFYDKKGQKIQVLSNHQLNTALNNINTVVPDFSGRIARSKQIQIAGTINTTVQTEWSYDHADRITAIDESLNGAAMLRIASYTYNEIGQLIDKKLHSTNSGSTHLQSIDYRYTIRGQLKSINNSKLVVDDKNDDANDVFGMEFVYETVDAEVGNQGYFNGSISAVKWKSKTSLSVTPFERSYKFNYDKLNRLTSAVYADKSIGGVWGNNGAYDEKGITYDHNGNIVTLKRNALLNNSISEIDNLNYAYTANQLTNITDGAGANYNGYGFRNIAASTAGYVYNSSGALTTDSKKGLLLEYNAIGRTSKVTMTGSPGRYINYTYDATGVLLRKEAYDNNTLVKTTDYIEGFVYENKALSHFKMAEGRVRNNSGSLKYEYMIADNMGNVRVSFEEVSGVAVVRQENSYYPFGMIMPGGYLPSSANKNLYNAGSEWQDDFSNLPDYYSTFYRNYDAAIGRFIAVDPRAEATESLTTYHYGLNNPVMNNDPNGDISQTAWNNMLRLVERGLNNMDEDGYVFNENTGDNGTPLFRQGREIGYYENTGIEFFNWDRSGIIEANGVYAGNSKYTWAFMPLGLSPRTQQNAQDDGCQNCLDPSTVGHNLLGLTYPGGNNPMSLNQKNYNYSYVPKNLGEYPAIGHDRRYDNLKIKGASGLFIDTKVIGADWKFVGEQMQIASSPFLNTIDRISAGVLGVGLGLSALPKTIFQMITPLGYAQTMMWYNISNQGVNNAPTIHKH